MQEILATLLIKHQLSTQCRWGSQLIASCVWQTWASHNSLHTGMCLSFCMTSWWMDIPHLSITPSKHSSTSSTNSNAKKCKMVSTEVKMVLPSLSCKMLAWNIQAVISYYTKMYKVRKWKAMQLTLEVFFFFLNGNLTTVWNYFTLSHLLNSILY